MGSDYKDFRYSYRDEEEEEPIECYICHCPALTSARQKFLAGKTLVFDFEIDNFVVFIRHTLQPFEKVKMAASQGHPNGPDCVLR